VLEIDGSFGEGGGQILRTALALSLITDQPFRITRIRANRAKPGLRRQHLTAIRAAAEIGSADIFGAEVSSLELTFTPRRLTAGDYAFSIGTGGSAALVFQTVLPPLMIAAGPSNLSFEGGTHNSGAPPLDYIERVFLPVLAGMGPRISVRLVRYGFALGGRGCFEVQVQPSQHLAPVQQRFRGAIRERRLRILTANLPEHIAQREADIVRARWPDVTCRIDRVDAVGPGNIVMIEVETDSITELFTGFGERGVPAETVARAALASAAEYIDASVPVSEHLADQLLIPMALGEGGSFLTTRPTLHTKTNAEVIRRFLPVSVDIVERGRAWEVRVRT
jgi:RNA 3'-terminal phosphate cyclase (ATP)